MSLVLLTTRADWQQISSVVLAVAEQCKSEPHYVWVERPTLAVLARELELLFRNLGLEEQWAYIEPGDEQPGDVSRVVVASDAN